MQHVIDLFDMRRSGRKETNTETEKQESEEGGWEKNVHRNLTLFVVYSVTQVELPQNLKLCPGVPSWRDLISSLLWQI